jgi:hypothetical protein
MGSSRSGALSFVAVSLLAPSNAAAYGEPVDGYPSREERQILVGINRVRADPNDQDAGNASACSTPHPPIAPVVYDVNLSRAARFHCAHLTLNGGGLSHQTFCTLDPAIASNGCDGSAACSCVAGTECWSCTTLGGCGSGPGERASIFGAQNYASEVGAANYGALGAAMGWATECPPAEGHRDALSNGSLNVAGTGFAQGGTCWGNYEFADFGIVGGLTIPPIVSAADGPGVIEANWYDPAGDPVQIDAVIDGVCVPMAIAVGIEAGNRDYRAPFTPTGACQEYFIVARNLAGDVVRHPDVGSITVGCAEEYVPTQADADCAACNAGETRPCFDGACEGTQGCEDGVWGACDAPAECGGGGSGGTGSGGDTGNGGSGAGSGAGSSGDVDDGGDGGVTGSCTCRAAGAPRADGLAWLVALGLAATARSRACRRARSRTDRTRAPRSRARG